MPQNDNGHLNRLCNDERNVRWAEPIFEGGAGRRVVAVSVVDDYEDAIGGHW